jgi:hypothetical protein
MARSRGWVRDTMSHEAKVMHQLNVLAEAVTAELRRG